MPAPTALGLVLATLTDAAGKPVRGGAVRGQLYATQSEVVVLRPTAREEIFHRAGTWLLLGSIAAVLVNLAVWKSVGVLWAAIVAQGLYWLTLPARRRSVEPQPLAADGLEAARRAGRAAVFVPAADIVSLVAPEPPRPGFRKPARLALRDAALEIYLSADQFETLRATLGR
jgi:hypothetical protein